MAFRGSCEENIEEEINRNIIKSGASLERVDIFLRLGYPQEQCLKEVRHLASRLKKAQLAVNENNMQFLLNSLAGSPENLPPAPRQPGKPAACASAYSGGRRAACKYLTDG